MSPKKNKRRRLRKKQSNRNQSNQNVLLEADASLEPHDPKRFNSSLEELDYATLGADVEKLSVGASSIHDQFFILGEGSFGLVTLGVLEETNGRRVRVALKGANSSEFYYLIVREAKILSQLDHKNVVKILAVQKDPLKIALEYMGLGDILDALKTCAFTDMDLLNALHDVASGMEYIALKQFVHRDLACRNVFVNHRRQCKVGDFGLCMHVGDSGGVLTMSEARFCNIFCAPEVAETKTFSTKCDIWSMGLLVWELYFAASRDVPVFFKKFVMEDFCLTREEPLPKPRLCPQDLYVYTTTRLLHEDPSRRPKFTEVKGKISGYITK